MKMIPTHKVLRTSRSYMRIFSITLFIIFCVFLWLGIQERLSIQEMNHLINTDVRHLELYQKYIHEKIKDRSLLTEMEFHLNKSIKTSHFIYAVILLAVVLLSFVWMFTILHYRRLKKMQLTEQQLENLLYYDQISDAYPVKQSELTETLNKLQIDKKILFGELQNALNENQFILYYQPIVHASNERIVQMEALIRWQHPVYHLLSPDIFLPLCEQSGLIIPLGKWTLESACRQIKKWHAMGFPELSISVNLSANQLNDPTLLPWIKKILTTHKLASHSLKLEITENTFIKNMDRSIHVLQTLREIGLQLSLDDFGTGYSSLQYLKRIPVSNIKIDKMFVNDMATNITSLGIVESVITLGKNLGLTITAEGVENENQLHLLKKIGCDFVQGYLYSEPISDVQFTQLLLSSEKTHMNFSFPLKKYQYHILTEAYYYQAVDVITSSFCQAEPMTKHLGITYVDFLPFAKFIVAKAIQEKLSMIALDHNKVIACTIVEDMADTLNINVDIDPRFKIIFSLLESLGKDFFSQRSFEKGQVAHLFITAVDKKYHGQGLSKEINFETMKIAKEKKFAFMCCEFTHIYNEKGTVKNLKHNRLLIRSYQYKDFVFAGDKPFENLDGFVSAYIWELQEGAKLKYRINALDT